MYTRRVGRLGVLLVFMVGCADGFSLTDLAAPDVPVHAISDGTFGGTPGFNFLPPIVKQPAYAGTFDPGHEPIVEVVCVAGGCDGAEHAVFGQGSGAGSSAVRASEADEHYIVNWHSGETGALAGRTYRIRVHVGDTELGFVDVAVVRPGRDLINARSSGLVAIVAGQTLPIKFRIETDIITALVVTPAEATVNVGEAEQFTATFFDLHGQEVAGPAVAWSSSDGDVATVSNEGLATGAGPGQATIAATAGLLSGSGVLTVEAPEPSTTYLSPGDVSTVATLDGWSVQCLAWSGRVCVHPQVMMDCGTCGVYEECGVWHDLTNANNNLQQRATQNFCAIATGSAAVASTGSAGAPVGPRACAFDSSEHPMCGLDQATFHAAGFGINTRYGLLLNDEVCGWDGEPRLTMECAAW